MIQKHVVWMSVLIIVDILYDVRRVVKLMDQDFWSGCMFGLSDNPFTSLFLCVCVH